MGVHDKLSRVRKPRVHITYEVETDGASVQRELPFVVGVLGDFSGNPTTPLKPLKERKFVNIDRDNFHDVLAGAKPAVNLRVGDKLSGGEDAQLSVALKFRHLSDFEPEQVVKQVEPLRKLMEARQRLTELKSKLDGNDRLEDLLTKVLNNPSQIGELKDAVGLTDETATAAKEEEPK